jgi:serine/threonine protein kinase
MNPHAPLAPPSAPADRALTDLVEEFAARLQAGEVIDAETFARAHPAHAEHLRRLLPAVRVLAEVGRTPSGDSAGAPPLDDDFVPERLGDFRLLREVGRGGMGIVYEAEQVSLGRRVALKVLPSAAALDGRALQRFKNEAQAAALLQHPNIVPVIAVGCEHGTHFFAMQFIDGTSLAALIHAFRGLSGAEDHTLPGGMAEGSDPTMDLGLTPPDAPPPATSTFWEALACDGPPALTRSYFRAVARMGLQAAEALEHAHQLGVIHRDVKPANLLVDGRGNLWVTDFGLARLQHDAGLTASGDLVGTIRYMSPEQAQPRHVPLDHRTDVYALGATLYELLTLQPAFPGDDRRELLRRIAWEEPRRPRRVNKAVPAELEAVALKAMEKAPADRYPTAQELAEDLKRYLADEPVRARRPALWRSAARWARRHAAMAVTAAAALSVVLLTLAVAVTLLSINNSRLRQAQVQSKEALEQKSEALWRARDYAVRANRNAGLVQAALNDVTWQLADEQLKRDPNWARKAEGLLARAQKVYEDLIAGEEGNPAVQMGAGRGFRHLGGIYKFLGRYEQARKVYQRGIGLFTRLAGEHPHDDESRAQLAGTYNDLGDLHRQVGKRQDAAACYQASLQSWQRGVPKTACPVEASRAHDGTAELRAEAGERHEAVEHFRQAITLREPLAQADPAHRGHREALASWHRRLGALLQADGELDAAAEHFRRAYELAQGLVRDHRNVGEYVLELARCCNHRAALYEDSDPERAEKFYRRSGDLLSSLAGALPGVPVFRQGLAFVHVRRGTLALAADCPDEAAEHFREARDLLSALTADLPGGGPGPGAPGENENAFAWFLATCPDESFRDPPRAVALARTAVERAPERGDYWNTLGAACYRAGDAAGAVQALEKAVRLHHGGCGADWFFLALAHVQRGEGDRARDCHQRALAWMRRHKAGGHELRLLRAEAAAALEHAELTPEPPTASEASLSATPCNRW